MILTIIGGALAIIGIVTIIIGRKKISLNKKIQEINYKLEKDYEILENKRISLNQENGRLYRDIQILEQQKQQKIKEYEEAAENYFNILDIAYEMKENEFDTKIRLLQQDYENELNKAKNSFYLAFTKYADGLESEYNKAEENFDIQLKNIKQVIQEHQKELDKIQKTYAAAIEAQLREAEIQQSLEFFCLHLTPAEQSTIAMIEDLKLRLPEPRVLSMLIWQTFYQKKMNTLCLNILKKATPICGIYKITNRKTGLCYIGQSVDIAKRWKDHAKCGLGIDTPAQNKLYQAMFKDGLTNFTFELLEECDRDLLNEKEKFYINLYQACDYGYNSTVGNK